MREISKEYLENVENEYLNNVGCTITRRALVKNKISDLTRVNEQTEFTRDMFSINLQTKNKVEDVGFLQAVML